MVTKAQLRSITLAHFLKLVFQKNLATTFIWDTYLKYMMEYSNNDCDPSIKEVVKYVCREIVNFVKNHASVSFKPRT